MGLDNGVRIKNFDKNYKKFFTPMFDWEDEDGEFEICYWRKCWNVREVFIETLHMSNSVYEKEIEIDDIDALIRHLTPLLSKDGWEEGEYDSIWTFEESFPGMIDCVCNLKMLKFYMQEHPNCKVYFYDSY